VQIDLCKITTNQELVDVIFDQSYNVAGQDFPIRMAFSEVIFVMEDVDAATDIVLSRKSSPKELSLGPAAEVAVGLLSDLATAGAKSGKDDELKETDCATKGDENDKFGSSPVIIEKDDAVKDSNSSGDTGLVGLLEGFGKTKKSEDDKKSDKLNLSGLLNVLDGIVDTPGRLLIMTSNHPEKLDDALTRPGRIDKVIQLGYLEPPEAIEMIKYYFPDDYMTERQENQIAGIISGNSFEDNGFGELVEIPVPNPYAKKFTPAEV
jgi:hypothetical protein